MFVPNSIIDIDNKRSKFIIRFDYSPGLVSAVKELIGRKWEQDLKIWSVPVNFKSIVEVENFAKKNGFRYTPEAKEFLVKNKSEYEENIKDNFKSDTDLDTSSIKGELRPFQKVGIQYALKTKRMFIADEMGTGKAQPLSSKILTPDGWKQMGDMHVGQKIIGQDGKIYFVTGVYPQGKKDIYEVEFTDKSRTKCCADHLWNVNSPTRRFRGNKVIIKPLRGIIGDIKYKDGKSKWFIPMVEPVQFKAKQLPLHPYLLGALLGDGTFRKSLSISTPDIEIIKRIQQVLPTTNLIKKNYPEGVDRYDYNIINKGSRGHQNPVTRTIKQFGLWRKYSHEKFIPKEYLLGSVEDRVELLKGLMDTDGYISKDGDTVQYSTSSKQLAENFVFLVQSLGGTAKVSSKIPYFTYKGERKRGKKSYTISIRVLQWLNPFYLPRKALKVNTNKKYIPCRAFKSIEHVGKHEAQCISTNAPGGLYITDDFIVTHNTAQSIATIHLSNSYPCIVVCPASLKLNWEREINKWLDGKTTQVISSKDELQNADFYVINYDIIARRLEDLKKINAKSIIFDESHRLKNYRAKSVVATRKLVKNIPTRLALSGTPILSKPKELISQLQVLGRLNDFGGFYGFAQRYCDMKKTYFGLDLSGASNLDELNKVLRATCYIRREKKEVLKELPPKQQSVIPMEVDNELEYKQTKYGVVENLRGFAKEEKAFHVSISKLDKEKKKEVLKSHLSDKAVQQKRTQQLTQIEELKQMAAKGKMKNVLGWIDDFLETGEKLVVFAYHKKVVKELADHFKCPSITGDTPMDRRQEYVDMFQNDPSCKIIILNIRAGGVGLTLTAASNVAFVELDWTPAMHSQCEDRVSRIGQTKAVNIWYLLGVGTVDEEIYELIEKKREIVNAATDGEEKQQSLNILSELISRLTSA